MLPSNFLREIAKRYGLTEKEQTVFLKKFGTNKSYQTIADELHLSTGDLKRCLTGVYKKFSISSSGPVKSDQLFRFLTEEYRSEEYRKSHPTSFAESIGEELDMDTLEQEDGITFSISLSNDFTEESFTGGILICEALERTLNYEITQINQQIQITPQMEYLTKLDSGIPITDLGMVLNIPPYFRWQFPNLDLRIVNNSNKTIYITDVFIDVENSILDPYPVLVIPGEQPNALHFLLVNDGWGDVQDAVVRFSLVPKGHSILFKEPYQHEIQIGSFSNSYNVDISDALRQMDVDVDFINGLNNCREQEDYTRIRIKLGDCSNLEEFYTNKDYDEDYKRIINALGVFKDSINTELLIFPAIAYGEVCFTGSTVDGINKYSIVKFSTEVTLLVPGSYGAPAGPSYQYSTKLDIDREKYQVRVQGNGSSVSQYLKSGEVDRFNIRVGVAKSSLHTFRLRLVYNNNQSILSSPITLKVFVPKSEADSIREIDAFYVEEGQRLAREGDIDGAVIKFKDALQQNPSLSLNPFIEAQKFAASYFIRKGNEFIENGKLKEAIKSYIKAKHFDSRLEVSAYSWNIQQVERLNERIAIANSLCRDIVHANGYCISWQPQSELPSILEVLIWLWVVHPNAWQTINTVAPQEFRNAIVYYNSQQQRY